MRIARSNSQDGHAVPAAEPALRARSASSRASMPLARRCRHRTSPQPLARRAAALLLLLLVSGGGGAAQHNQLRAPQSAAGHQQQQQHARTALAAGGVARRVLRSEAGAGAPWHPLLHNDTAIKSTAVSDSATPCSQEHVAIVVNHYKEEPGDVRRVVRRLRALFTQGERPCVHIYTKGPLNATEVKAVLRGVGDYYYQVENIGREGHSWLTYIVHHYHRLPGHVLFTQALPNGEDRFWSRAAEAVQHYREDSFACLGDKSFMYKCDGASMMGRVVRLREVWALTQHRLCPPTVHICYRGQFLVSNESVHRQPRRFYLMMKQYMEAGPAHWIHDDVEHMDRRDGHYDAIVAARHTRDNSLLGHVMERMWMAVFDCQERNLRQDRNWACDASKLRHSGAGGGDNSVAAGQLQHPAAPQHQQQQDSGLRRLWRFWRRRRRGLS